MKKSILTFILVLFVVLTSGCTELAKVTSPPQGTPFETEATPADTLNESDYADLFIEEDRKNNRISFLCAGDNVIHPALYIEAKRRADESTRTYNFLPMYSDVAELIASYDITFINQETLMAGDEKYGLSGYPHFNSPQDLAYDLQDLGFDIVNIANNHMVDKGESGLSDTLDFYDTLDFLMIGGYRNNEDYNAVRIYEEDGVKIAMLSYTYGTNGLKLPSSSDLVIPYLNEDTVERQIKDAREKADLVFVSVHWGEENYTTPFPDQKKYAKIMTDAGADVIIGHHPHVIQPIEWMTGKDGNTTLCIYSLGNLVSEMAKSINMVGGFVTFDIVVENGGVPFIDNVKFIPTIFHYGMNYFSTHLYFMEDYNEELASKHGTRIYGSTSDHTYTYKDFKALVKEIIDDEFLPDYLKSES